METWTRVRSLIAEGAHINAMDNLGRTPLERVSYEGHEIAAKILIEAGADVNAKGNGRRHTAK